MFAKFKELKDGIERTMAEEQSRLKRSAEQKPDNDKSPQDPLEGAPPATFETIFKDAFNNSPGESTPVSTPSDTPQPAASASGSNPGDDNSPPENNDAAQPTVSDTDNATTAPAPEATAEPTVSPEITKKLRKLDKIEAQYTSLIRSYKIAHTRVTAIDSFEKALREHTPLDSVKQHKEFIKYVEGMDEEKELFKVQIRRILDQKQALEKKQEELEAEIVKSTQRLGASNERMEEIEKQKSEEIAKLKNDLMESQRAAELKETELKNLQVKCDEKDAELTSERVKHEAAIKQYQENANKQRPQSTAPGPKKPSKKSNKKNQKKNGGSQPPTDVEPSESLEPSQPSDRESDSEVLRAENVKLKEDITRKDVQIEELTKKRRDEALLLEDQSMLQQEVIELGNELCNDKRQLQESRTILAELQSRLDEQAEQATSKATKNQAELETRISELEDELAASKDTKNQAESASEWRAKYDTKQKEVDELKAQLQTTQSELNVAENLAEERFKNLTNLKDSTTKILAENKNLRQTSAALDEAKKNNESLQKKLRDSEKDAREMVRLRRDKSDQERELKELHANYDKKKKEHEAEESKNKAMSRNMTKLEAEKEKIAFDVKAYKKQLGDSQEESTQLRSSLQRLNQMSENKEAELQRTKKDEELKSLQYDNAEKLLASMRHQITELETRLREQKSHSQSLEEELAASEVHLREREGETTSMRRMMADAKREADARVSDITTRMEIAIKERDLIEDTALADARKHARNVEEYKAQIKDKESRLNPLTEDYSQLQARYQELLPLQERQKEVEMTYETTISELRSALDEYEKQARETEKQDVYMKKLLDAARAQREKDKKELKALQQSQPKKGASAADSGVLNDIDRQYMKNILLQLLQAKESYKRIAMVPAFTRVLPFDENETEKFKYAVEGLTVRSG